MPLDLLKRGEKPSGAAGDLTAEEHDANFTLIENEVNAKANLGHTHTSAEVTGTFGNARLADMLEGTIKGRAIGGGTGEPQDLTGEQVLEVLGIDLDALSLPVVDTTALVHDPDNDTKRMRIDVGAVSGGATRAIIMGDRDVNVAAGGTFAELDHTHELADVTDAGALAAQDDITASQISDATADGLAVLTAADANPFTDAEQTKLAGIEAGAEVNQNAFSSVAVSGQDTVEADAKTDTLTLVAGSNVTITTSAAGDSITISSTPGGAATEAFTTIAVSGQSDVVADSAADTLTLVAGANIALTTDAGADSVTVAVTGLSYASAAEVQAGTEAAKVVSPATLTPRESLVIACSDETTALTTGSAKVTFRMPYAFKLSSVKASVTTAPTGADLIVDINEAGATIMTTDKITIGAGQKSSKDGGVTQPGITDADLADDAEMTIDVDQIGSSVAGAGLKVVLIGNRVA